MNPAKRGKRGARSVGILALALACGCAAAPTAVEPEPRAFLLTEGRDGKLLRAPVRLGGEVVRVGQRYGTAVLPLGEDVFAHGPAKGLSGSPVIDADGDTLGALARVMSGDRGGAFAVLPEREFAEAFRRAEAHEPDPDTDRGYTPVPPEIWSEVARGTSIAAVSIWGDLVVAESGVVSARNGDSVLTFAHGLRRQGACVYALTRAPVLGSTNWRGQAHKVASTGDPLGTLFYDGFNGGVARLGLAPPSLGVRVRMAAAHPPTDWRFHVVRDPRRGRQLLRTLAQRVAAQLGPQIVGSEWMVASATPDRGSDRTMVSSGATALSQALERAWTALAVEQGELGAEALDVVITRLDESSEGGER